MSGEELSPEAGGVAAVSGEDLSTEAGVLAYAETLLQLLRAHFDEKGSLGTGLVCLAMRHEGERFDAPTPVVVLVDDLAFDMRDAGARVLRGIVTELQAVGVFFFNESWSVDFESDEERLAWRNRDWGKHPRAIEFVGVTFEHRDFASRIWRAMITRDAAGRPTLGAFVGDLCRAKGRFAQWFPRAEPHRATVNN